MSWIASVATAAALAAAPGCEHSSGKQPVAPEKTVSRATRVPAEYLVTLAAGADPAAIAAAYGRFGVKGTRDLGRGVFLVTLAEDPGPGAMEEARRGDPRIQAVQPNFVYQAIDAPGGSTSAPGKKPAELAPPADGGR